METPWSSCYIFKNDELVYLKPNKKGRDPREGHTKSPNPV
jgi:hypothetical protein